MEWFERLKKRIRGYAREHGFTCDGCGAELFDYPAHRLCVRCEDTMHRNDGRMCEKCGRKTLADGVCLSCKSCVPRFTKGFSPFVYRGESASFINRVKNSAPNLAWYFAENMADCLIERCEEMAAFSGEGEECLLLIPVPLTKVRLRTRGYNQAALLAEGIASALTEKGYRVAVREDILEKTRDTAQQKNMGYEGRMDNVAGAYHVHKRKDCRGRTVVLVDDIMTTGATGSECASRLISAGAERVFFAVAAARPEQK